MLTLRPQPFFRSSTGFVRFRSSFTRNRSPRTISGTEALENSPSAIIRFSKAHVLDVKSLLWGDEGIRYAYLLGVPIRDPKLLEKGLDTTTRVVFVNEAAAKRAGAKLEAGVVAVGGTFEDSSRLTPKKWSFTADHSRLRFPLSWRDQASSVLSELRSLPGATNVNIYGYTGYVDFGSESASEQALQNNPQARFGLPADTYPLAEHEERSDRDRHSFGLSVTGPSEVILFRGVGYLKGSNNLLHDRLKSLNLRGYNTVSTPENKIGAQQDIAQIAFDSPEHAERALAQIAGKTVPGLGGRLRFSGYGSPNSLRQ